MVPSLLPVAQHPARESESGGELALAELQLPPHFPHIHLGNHHRRDAHTRDVLALRPPERILRARDDALTCRTAAFHRPLPFWYSLAILGIRERSSLRSALLRFAFSFFANISSTSSGTEVL